MRRVLFVSLAVAAALAACGGVSVAPTPTASCGSRGCDRALERASSALECRPERVLVRDLGVDRYRGTGCGRTVVLDCAHGCDVTEPVRAVSPRDEVAYRASFELLCAPADVAISEEGEALVARCRDVGVRYACGAEGCERVGPVDAARYALRQLEPDALGCLSRSRIDLRISFDPRGDVVRVDADGIRPVRMRGFERDRESAETKQECLRAVFEPLPAFPELAGQDLVFPLGGRGARRPAQLSVMAPAVAEADVDSVSDADSEADTDADSEADTDTDADSEADSDTDTDSDSDAEADADSERVSEAGAASDATPTSPEQAAAEASLRAALDARAGAVLACTGTATAVLEVRAPADGPLAVALRGALAGSPEEGCVRSAISTLVRPAGLGRGVMVHLVEAGAPAAPPAR